MEGEWRKKNSRAAEAPAETRPTKSFARSRRRPVASPDPAPPPPPAAAAASASTTTADPAPLPAVPPARASAGSTAAARHDAASVVARAAAAAGMAAAVESPFAGIPGLVSITTYKLGDDGRFQQHVLRRSEETPGEQPPSAAPPPQALEPSAAATSLAASPPPPPSPPEKAVSDEDDDDDDDEDMYEVDALLDRRRGEGGGVEYLVKWKGWGHRFNTWEPAAHITSPQLLREFVETRLRADGRVPPLSLSPSPAVDCSPTEQPLVKCERCGREYDGFAQCLCD